MKSLMSELRLRCMQIVYDVICQARTSVAVIHKGNCVQRQLWSPRNAIRESKGTTMRTSTSAQEIVP